jgi:biotin synthase
MIRVEELARSGANSAAVTELLARTEFDEAGILALLSLSDPGDIERLRRAAFDLTTAEVGDAVHYRGLIEISNICALDCRYCGIRKGNRAVERYSLSREEIVNAALWSAQAGYGSCVLQAGERRDPRSVGFIEDCVREIKERSVSDALPEGLGITLSLGEQSAETYRRWRAAGAHRYLLRIETSSRELFARIHPECQRFEARLKALDDLREAGFQVGTGVMIGLPGQTLSDLAADIRFFRDRDIDMIGMGPYITAPENAMADGGMMERDALLSLSVKMIAAVRLVLRDVNIASTTALQALVHDGRERGIAFGANVVMPNLTPREVRKNYQLYEGKPCIDEARAECRGCLERRVLSCGRRVGWNSWGDPRHYQARQSRRDRVE